MIEGDAAATPSAPEGGRLHAQRQRVTAKFATTQAERCEDERDSTVPAAYSGGGATTVTEEREGRSAEDKPVRLVDKSDLDSAEAEIGGMSPRPLQEGQRPQPPEGSAGTDRPEGPPPKPSDAATSASPPAKDE